MDKSFLKDIKNIISLIKDLDSCDYIDIVRYVIFIISKVLYGKRCKNINLSTTPNLNFNTTNVFNKYSKFNLNNSKAEEAICNLIQNNIDNINLNEFSPGEFYEALLTTKEKKNLGQVYTPSNIIHLMLSQVFEIKTINKNIKILDPSCGGGYFLIRSFKKIKSELKDTISDKYIIENILYGIDIDDFSIFLTKVGLLFCSDSIDLADANFNIYNLDYLTDSFDLNNFDIVVGNPPYVGHKNTSMEYKKILYEKYDDVYYDKADISYCFFKKSKELLKNNGVLSFITSRYFMEALYADRIRSYIKTNFHIISLVDFNGIKVFKDAMVSPALITLCSDVGNKDSFSYVKQNINNSNEYFSYKQDKLNDSGWIILRDEDQALFDKIESISNTYIRDVCTIKQGIITGLDKAFIVDENIIEKYKIERHLLKKWIKNSNITKSNIKYNNLYLIYTNIIDNEENYPNAIKYLSTFKEKLQNRRECLKGYRKWYELQWGRIEADFNNPKVVFPYKSSGNNFYYDEKKYFCSADIYLMNNFTEEIQLNYFLSYLNSHIFEFYFKCLAKKVGNNIYEYYPNKLSNIKIFLPEEKGLQNISELGKISIELFLKKVFNISKEEVNIIEKYVEKG